jgi:hypothetical protein
MMKAILAATTWKWIDAHGRTGGKPVYRYFYSRPRPAMKPEKGTAGPATGLPAWAAANKGDDIPVLHIDVVTSARPDSRRARYLFLDQVYAPKPGGSR